MSLEAKRILIGALGILFLVSLVLVQWMEVVRKEQEAGLREHKVQVPASSSACVECHGDTNTGIVDHWLGSTHAKKGVGCYECHKADKKDADAFDHYGKTIAVIVTPRDCGQCHTKEFEEFTNSHHAKAGNILHSLDNFLAETVEGSRVPFDPHSKTVGRPDMSGQVNGMASALVGCWQCHGSLVGLEATDGSVLTVKDLAPDENGRPTNTQAVAKIKKNEDGMPIISASGWPNTGIGRINLDGSRGSCSACHSRHDFSPRRARQPENCGKCHLGPDHPQKEIYEESKHGIAYRDLKDKLNLDSTTWVLGEDYSAAPTCATCHMSANTRNDKKITHDPGERISWTNRPPISLPMDTDINHKVITEADPAKRREMIADTWEAKRTRMKNVCNHCHTKAFANAFYKQYDDFIHNYNEKFAKPGLAIMTALLNEGLRTKTDFDEKIEWTWFYLWHHEGRRARHGASMMAPDYAHWHGMYEVAERFYEGLIPEAREMCAEAEKHGKGEAAKKVLALISAILSRPEHEWQGKR